MPVRSSISRATPSSQSNHSARRSITVLGSTGSIGLNTVDVLMRKREMYDIKALTANSRVDALIEQARHVMPQRAVIGDKRLYKRLKEGLAQTPIDVAAGHDAVVEAAMMDADWVMAAIVGATALKPVMAAVERGCILALANKETLVCAGDIICQKATEHGTTIIPVDSEHSAIFQVFDTEQTACISKIVLTASGGPFFSYTSQHQLKDVTPEQALAHPNWDMGAKISIDSATMMNKGLELIEACQLFPVKEESIDIVVHPQSIVHSAVCYSDGSMLAHMGVPDMRTPISYALGWPERISAPVETLDLTKISTLTFFEPNDHVFPSLRLARQCQQQGGTAPMILNVANEIAVEAFLQRRIPFLEIVTTVQHILDKTPITPIQGLDDVIMCEQEIRRSTQDYLDHKVRPSHDTKDMSLSGQGRR
ncbi:MAG: 1-deoxy-D-xylulose-5-phosphate reductoisomerase [Alphaproteobacteria bacterium GM7ARS4]|nr:1-deoxy-D-xylulose-5-phosphate reductoisomerase [Alphaproteobacteria bacterium GM7ARS4]